VIEDAQSHELQRFSRLARDEFVGLTGLGDARWMIMRLRTRRHRSASVGISRYEQNTQQSPAFGFSSTPQPVHS